MTTPPPSLKPEALASLVHYLTHHMGPKGSPRHIKGREAATTIETLEADVAALRDALERVVAIGDAPVETPVGRINPGEMARAATMRIGAALVQLFPDLRTTLERTAR